MAIEPQMKSGGRRAFRVGKYQIESTVSLKALGQVNRARADGSDRDCMLVILPAEISTNKTRQDVLQRVVSQASEVQHENLLTVLDCGNSYGTWFLAMEWTDPVDLHDFIEKQHTVEESDAILILRQLAGALQCLHENSLVHHNVRPGTILAGGTPGAPVAKLIHPAVLREPREEEWRSTSGGLKVGPADYRAPELDEQGKGGDIRSDLYSLGCVLYHLLAGRPPYADSGTGSRTAQHRAGKFPEISRFNSSVSQSLAALLPKLLAPDPQDRLPSPAKLLHLLKSIDLPPRKRDEGAVTSPQAVEDLFSNRQLLSSLSDGAATARPHSAHHEDDDAEKTYGLAASKPAAEPKKTIPQPSSDRGKTGGQLFGLLPDQAARSSKPEGPSRKLSVPPPSDEDEVQHTPAKASDDDPGTDESVTASAPRPPANRDQISTDKEASAGPTHPIPEPRRLKGSDDPVDEPAPNPEHDYKKLIYVSVAVVFFVIVGAVLTKVISSAVSSNDETSSSSRKVASRPIQSSGTGSSVSSGSGSVSTSSSDQGSKGTWKVLYPRTEEINADQLFKDCQEPWAALLALDTSTAPIYRVSRVPVDAGNAPKADKSFDSIGAACAAVAEGQTVVIEIMDNGPLYETPLVVKNRTIVLRPALGYRPLIVWDVPEKSEASTTDNPPSLVTLSNGILLVYQVEIAVKCAKPLDTVGSLFRVIDGDVWFHGCVFSVAGKPSESRPDRIGAAIVRFEGDAKGKTCRFSECFGRGTSLVAVDSSAPAAEIMLDHCLMVGADAPLLVVTAGKEAGPSLRCVRTTLVSGKSAVQVRLAPNEPKSPALKWFGWDSLISRAALKPGGVMVNMPAGADYAGITWKAVNCLYGGWEKLIDGPEPLATTQINDWHKRWQLTEGDIAIADLQRLVPENQLVSVLPGAFFPLDTAFAYEATVKEFDQPQPLGFPGNLTMPPPETKTYITSYVRTNWLAQTYDRSPMSRLEPVQGAPVIDEVKDGKYHGERIDLNKLAAGKSDLGTYLSTKRPLAEKVVMHLAGTGEVEFRPIAMENVHLVLYVEPPKPGTRPLVLKPVLDGPVNHVGFIQVKYKDLELINVTVLVPDGKSIGEFIVAVIRGNLRLQGCKLLGPWKQIPDGFVAQVGILGRGPQVKDLNPFGLASNCQIHESLLESGKSCLSMVGTSSRLLIEQSALVALVDAIRLDPYFNDDPSTNSLNTYCLLDHATIAARRGAVFVLEARNRDLPSESPYEVVVDPITFQSRASVYLNPYAVEGKPAPAGVLLYQGAALSRGTLVWQGDGDVYDKRLQFMSAMFKDEAAAIVGDQSPIARTRLWGRLGNRQSIDNIAFHAIFDPKTPVQLESLILPADPNLKDPLPGANLATLGIKKQ